MESFDPFESDVNVGNKTVLNNANPLVSEVDDLLGEPLNGNPLPPPPPATTTTTTSSVAAAAGSVNTQQLLDFDDDFGAGPNDPLPPPAISVDAKQYGDGGSFEDDDMIEIPQESFTKLPESMMTSIHYDDDEDEVEVETAAPAKAPPVPAPAQGRGDAAEEKMLEAEKEAQIAAEKAAAEAAEKEAKLKAEKEAAEKAAKEAAEKAAKEAAEKSAKEAAEKAAAERAAKEAAEKAAAEEAARLEEEAAEKAAKLAAEKAAAEKAAKEAAEKAAKEAAEKAAKEAAAKAAAEEAARIAAEKEAAEIAARLAAEKAAAEEAERLAAEEAAAEKARLAAEKAAAEKEAAEIANRLRAEKEAAEKAAAAAAAMRPPIASILITEPQDEENFEEPDSSFDDYVNVPAAPVIKGEIESEKKKTAVQSPVEHVDLFGFLRHVPPSAMDLIYWRCPLRSGVALGVCLSLLVSFAYFSFISVLANASLLLLLVSFAYVGFKRIVAAVQKTDEGHPFKELLATPPKELIPGAGDCLTRAAKEIMVRSAACALNLRHYFLVVDVVDSLKFGLALYLLTYLGEALNLLTLVTIGVVLLFSLPKIYEVNKKQIDASVEQIMAQIQAQLPVYKALIFDRVVEMWRKVAVYVPGVGGGARPVETAKDK